MKVYGSVWSAPVMRVLAALHEKDLEFDFVPVGMGAGEHKKDHFLSLNLFGQLPAFEDGDLKLCESRAITDYIARAYRDKGTPLVFEGEPMAKVSAWMEVEVGQETVDSKLQWKLWPDVAADAPLVNEWTEAEVHQFDPVASQLLRELVHKPMSGLAPDTAILEENGAKLAKVLDVYEDHLSQSKYLGCDCFTLADLHHLPALTYLMGTPVKTLFDARPKVSAWVADITARPAWAKVHALRNYVLKKRV